ncbi:MAG: YlxR family protein [Clostridia bacterium]|nr:YlxR family protein [Clostridia bacterium]
MTERRCAGCWQIKDRENLIKITNVAQTPVINPNSTTFGRSVYLCYNKSCIEAAFKKNKISKFLKTSVPNELKGQILNELRND